MSAEMSRSRADRCPGVLRPWPAEDGLLVRLRLVGGRVPAATLVALISIAEQYGDGRVHLTSRANLQLRALPADARGQVPAEVVAAIEATGLLPSRSHELARNIMMSPQAGLDMLGAWEVQDPSAGRGAADLRPMAVELDRLLCAAPALERLPGRFLFVLDDGRGDLLDRPCDLGLVALSAELAQLRVGEGWGPVVPLASAARELVGLAGEFVVRRGSGPEAAWHVRELIEPLVHAVATRPVPGGNSTGLPFGQVAGGVHVGVPDGVAATLAAELAAQAGEAGELVVTPWRGVLVPTPDREPTTTQEPR